MSVIAEILSTTERRHQRAAVARRMLDKAADVAPTLDWAMLGLAPEWLALPEPALALLARRVGAVLCAPAVKLWIDGPRIAAARTALGDAFLQALLAEHDVPAIEPAGRPRLDAAEQVGALLQATGAGVLLASLAPGPLQRAASGVLGASVAIAMPPAVAHSLIARAHALEAMA
jgi:hypothetical protein